MNGDGAFGRFPVGGFGGDSGYAGGFGGDFAIFISSGNAGFRGCPRYGFATGGVGGFNGCREGLVFSDELG